MLRRLHHGCLLVSDDHRIQNVPAAEAPPAIECPIPAVIDQIEKLIWHHQASTPWTLHGLPPRRRPTPDVKLSSHRYPLSFAAFNQQVGPASFPVARFILRGAGLSVLSVAG